MQDTAPSLHMLAQQAQGPGGMIQLMAQKGPVFQKDIPAATEFLALLGSVLEKAGVRQTPLDEEAPRVPISAPAVHHDPATRRVLVLADIPYASE